MVASPSSVNIERLKNRNVETMIRCITTIIKQIKFWSWTELLTCMLRRKWCLWLLLNLTK